MKNRFYISDTHFMHSNILTFVNADGSKVRDFSSVEEMDETMVENWNKVVKPEDQVYHLGDVAIKRKGLKLLDRLNGKKVLVKGNHDIFKLKDYLPYFKDIRSYVVMANEKLICSHIPIHIGELGRFKINVHGHTHSIKLADPRYINICVEHINYTPVHQDQLIEMARNVIEQNNL